MPVLAAQDHRDPINKGRDPILQKRQVHGVQPHREAVHLEANRELYMQEGSLF